MFLTPRLTTFDCSGFLIEDVQKTPQANAPSLLGARTSTPVSGPRQCVSFKGITNFNLRSWLTQRQLLLGLFPLSFHSALDTWGLTSPIPKEGNEWKHLNKGKNWRPLSERLEQSWSGLSSLQPCPDARQVSKEVERERKEQKRS